MAPAVSAPNPSPDGDEENDADDGVIGKVGRWFAGKHWRTSLAAAGMFTCSGVTGVAAALPPLGYPVPPALAIGAVVCGVLTPLLGGVGLYHAADKQRLPVPVSPASPAPTPPPAQQTPPT